MSAITALVIYLVAAVIILLVIPNFIMGRGDYVRDVNTWQARVYGRFLSSDATIAEREYRSALRAYLSVPDADSDDFIAAGKRLNAALLRKIEDN